MSRKIYILFKLAVVLLLTGMIFTSCISLQNGNTPYQAKNVVFKNVNVIPMTEEIVLENRAVYIKDGKIVQIGRFEDLNIPEGTEIIDGKGNYLSPGFGDMHVHIANEEDLKLFAANGVTLVRNMAGLPSHLDMKEQVKFRRITGPEIYTTGPFMDGAGAIWWESLVLEDPADVEAAIGALKEAGYDALKVYEMLSLPVYDEIIRVARELDMPVVGHPPQAVGLEHAIKSGQVSVEHFRQYNLVYRMDFETLSDKIDLTLSSGVWNCPTLITGVMMNNISRARKATASYMKYVDSVRKAMWNAAGGGLVMELEERNELTRILHEKGGNIVAGTDCGFAYLVPGFSLHLELELFVEAGLSPYEALETTTVNPAKMLGYEDRLGTIEVGKDADLVLLEKNPLEDISNTRTISGVMTKGIWYSAGDLQDKLDEVEKSVAAESAP